VGLSFSGNVVQGVHRLSASILHLIPHLSGGGAERQLSYLAPELARLGWDVHVAFLEEGPNPSLLCSKGIHLYKFNHWGNYDPLIIMQIVHLIKRIRPDIIQTWVLQMDIAGGIASYLMKTPQVLREPFIGRFSSANWKNITREWLARMNEAVIVSNSKGGDGYWASRWPQLNRFIIPNGLNLSEIQQSDLILPKEIGLPLKARFILYAGRLEPQKNLGNLYRAFSIVCKKYDVYGVICGDGPYMGHLKSAISDSGLAERILLQGFVKNIWSYMKLADVFVSVSYAEGRPNTVLEAMACGCPLIVSDIPAHHEFLDENSATFVNPEDPTEIAEAVGAVLMSPAQSRRRAFHAREKVSLWSIQKMAHEYEQVYKKVLRNRK